MCWDTLPETTRTSHVLRVCRRDPTLRLFRRVVEQRENHEQQQRRECAATLLYRARLPSVNQASQSPADPRHGEGDEDAAEHPETRRATPPSGHLTAHVTPPPS